MVLGVVAGLKNGELVMAGVVGGDCRDKMADRLTLIDTMKADDINASQSFGLRPNC